jgi:hypothetical protein
VASIEKGREDREAFGSNRGKKRKEVPSSSTNKEKARNKPFMMVMSSGAVRGKKRASLKGQAAQASPDTLTRRSDRGSFVALTETTCTSMEPSHKRRRLLQRSPSPQYKLDDEENDDYEPYVPVAQRRQEKTSKALFLGQKPRTGVVPRPLLRTGRTSFKMRMRKRSGGKSCGRTGRCWPKPRKSISRKRPRVCVTSCSPLKLQAHREPQMR